MLKTKVVNVLHDEYDVYIGRGRCPRTGELGKWGNPYSIGSDGTRKEVIEKYKNYVLTHPEMLEDLHELRGKVLGCWCKPKRCHGDILAELSDTMEIDYVRRDSG